MSDPATGAGVTTLSCGGVPTSADGDPIGAAASHRPDCDLRLVCRDGSLAANKCVLCRASSVLRETLGLQLPTPGELQLPTDSSSAWEVVLDLLSLETYPMQLVTMDNLSALLVLADKYDIPVVRGTCAHFLHINAPSLDLNSPLTCPANVLTAASLAIKYCSTHPSLQPYSRTVRQKLDDELAPLLQRPPEGAAAAGPAVLVWQVGMMRLVSQLEALVGTEEYLTTVVPEVQFKVSSSILAALRNLASRPFPLCQHCSGPVGSGHETYHSDCAVIHFTSLHTKGCRICGVAMPPNHARFCNSCAYRRYKPT